MKRPFGSLEPFLEGYREQEKKQKQEERPFPRIQAPDILELFARKKANSMTIFEIVSELMASPQEVIKLIEELVQKKLVSLEPGKEKGNDLVALTQRGKIYLSES